MGGDFTYQDAFMWFDNLDKLIMHANLKAAKEGLNVKLFYSTPACYLKAVKDANPSLPTKQDDFFPYASDSTAFWTGYFTSRPTTKFMERQGNNYLQTFKMLQVLANLPKTNMFVLNELKSAMGVMQHHDAITGTEKQHVAHDYERIVTQAIDDAFIIGAQAFNKLIKPEGSLSYERCQFNQSQCSATEQTDAFILTVYNNQVLPKLSTKVELPLVSAAYSVYDENGDKIPSEVHDLPSEYFAIPTRKSGATRSLYFTIDSTPALGFKSFFIKKDQHKKKREANKEKIVYDHFSNVNDYWKNIERTEVGIKNAEVHSYLPKLKTNDHVMIQDRDSNLNTEKDHDGNLNWDVLKDKNEAKLIEEGRKFESPRVLSKDGQLKVPFPILDNDEMRMLSDEPMVVEEPQEIVLENEYITLTIDKRTGWMNYSSKSDGTTLSYLPVPGYYIGCEGNNEIPANRSSGAYIFRPNMTASPELKTFQNFAIVNVIQSPLRQEVTVRYDETVTLIIGIDLKATYIKSILHINEGTEYVLRIQTNLRSNGAFFTDSNGRQMLKRIRNSRPQWNVSLAEPIPGNYYPVVSEIYIEDDDLRVVLNVDRARGGASLKDGWIEIMQHRRLKRDDAFGVGEALNETAGGTGLYSIDQVMLQIVTKSKDNLLDAVVRSHAFFSPTQLFAANANGVTLDQFKKMVNVYSFLKSDLPKGIHLLTVEPWSDRQVLLRFENYLDKYLSPDSIAVDLSNIFKTVAIKSLKETTLAANMWTSDYNKWEWSADREFSESFNREYGGEDVRRAREGKLVSDDGMTIRLKAKQIRTFIAEYEVLNI